MSPVELRFWNKVRIGDGCWEWTASFDKRDGYGWFRLGRRMIKAHRAAWTLQVGCPGEMRVCHKCDNRACVRPGHLFLGTDQDNCDDKIAKGREARGPALSEALRAAKVARPETVARGEDHGRSKLTADAVLAIRERLARGDVQARVARDYGVSPSAISRIAKGQYWRFMNSAEAAR